MKPKTAGVVVLYNPTENVLSNILTYSQSVQKLFIVDNSTVPNEELMKALVNQVPQLEYISLNNNYGIAKALNTAATKALQEDYTWLLTMDQDSRASDGMVEKLLQVQEAYEEGTVGIIAPRYVQQTDETVTEMAGTEEVDVVITSGNLLNLSAFREIGPFKEELFIDYVDHEFCLRLRLHNYKVLVNNAVVLFHELGNSKRHRLLGRPVIASHHNYIRRYYITRNRLAVLKCYKNAFPAYYHHQKMYNLGDLVKIIFFEEDKLRKVRSFIKAYIDFSRNQFGKYT